MNKFKLVAVLVLVAVLGFTSCSEEELMVEPVVTCDSIDVEYNKLVVDLALSNGWVPEEYSFNATTLGDDFLNPFADPNVQIFLFAYGTYAQDWANARNTNGCF
tara:strand:- start:3843 stop:4154 length:312 start_codon:yes stop_codon:yes gene_type:complete